MTREEAIANLNMISVAFVEPVTKEQRKLIDDTFEMAIQALSQEPCDDAIDREYLFKVLDDFCGHDRTATITLDTLADLVYDMPTVTQNPDISKYRKEAKRWKNKWLKSQKSGKWIPVSERLPEEREWYLAVFKEKDTGYQLIPRVADYIGKGENKWRLIDEDGLVSEYRDSLECIAWMPLPKPYEPQERSDKE